MNIGGDYYLIWYYLDGEFVEKGQILVYWDNIDDAAKTYARQKGIEYDKYETEFIREEDGDEI